MSRILLIVAIGIILIVLTTSFLEKDNSQQTSTHPYRSFESSKNVAIMKYVNVFDQFSNGINLHLWEVLNREENYNNELQYYVSENVVVNGGELHLTGKREVRGSKHYTSGLVYTNNDFPILYGHIKVRAKFPTGKGLFPAIWLAPISIDDYLPEIDIMEVIGDFPNTIYFVHHYRNDDGNIQSVFETTNIIRYEEFQTYELIWTKDKLEWLVNGITTFKTEENIPNVPMKLIMNLAIGGDWPGPPSSSTIFPAVFQIDSVEILHERDR